jgi:hypothetical protein
MASSLRPSIPINVCVAALLCAMLLFSVANAAREGRINAASGEIAAADPRPEAGTRVDGNALFSSTRLKVLEALILARQASAAPVASRGLLLGRAGALLAVADTERPGFAQATLVEAYLSGVRNGGADPAISALLKRSYRENPFLKDEGEWRIRYAVEHWTGIDRDLRARVIEEAAWLSSLSKPGMVHISLIFIGTPAFADYQRRMKTPLAADAG